MGITVRKHEMPLSEAMGVDEAILAMKEHFKGNEPFLIQHWKPAEERHREGMRTVREHIPPGPDSKVLDIGCFNGANSIVFRNMGYEVTGLDAENSFGLGELGIEFVKCNFNSEVPLRNLSDNSFDAVYFTEVFEHILNYPIGFLHEIFRVLKPEGILVFSTPNPSTLINAFRVLTNKPLLWGTDVFVYHQKFLNGEIICDGALHYREYTSRELEEIFKKANFSILFRKFIRSQTTKYDPLLKRIFKALIAPVGNTRLFGITQLYCLQKKR